MTTHGALTKIGFRFRFRLSRARQGQVNTNKAVNGPQQCHYAQN